MVSDFEESIWRCSEGVSVRVVEQALTHGLGGGASRDARRLGGQRSGDGRGVEAHGTNFRRFDVIRGAQRAGRHLRSIR